MVTTTNEFNVEYYKDLFKEITDILSNFVEDYIDIDASLTNNGVVTEIVMKSGVDKKYYRYEFGEMKEVDFSTSYGKQVAKDLYQAYLDVEKEVDSLEDYFGIIKTITDCINTNYQILPLITRNEVFIKTEEEPFEINANTRTIKPPNNNYTYAVSGDNLAETIYFSIDRYFDNEDLNTHNIAVLSSINGKKFQTPIEVKDITSVPNKIIFGWPIGKTITKQTSGTLEFSIRFYTVKGAEVEYSLNTLPAHITIKNSLDFLSDAETDYENGDEIIIDQSARFARELLQNGDIYKTAAIQTPVFYYETPQPEDGDYEITSTSSASLSAAAYSPDALNIEYEWTKDNEVVDESLIRQNEYISIGNTITQKDIDKYQIFYYKDASDDYHQELITEPISNGETEYYRLGSTITEITGPGLYQCIAKAKRSDIRYKVGKSSIIKIPEPSKFSITLNSGVEESNLIYRFGRDENEESAKDFLDRITENVMDNSNLKEDISLNLSGPVNNNIYTFSKTNTLNNCSVASKNSFEVTIYDAMPSDLNGSITYTCTYYNDKFDKIEINCNKYKSNTMDYELLVTSSSHTLSSEESLLDKDILIYKDTKYTITLTITSKYPSFNQSQETSTGTVEIPADGRY